MTRKKRQAAAATLRTFRTLIVTGTVISIALVIVSLLFFPNYIWIAIVAILALGCWALTQIIR